jgi:hypothetical protein
MVLVELLSALGDEFAYADDRIVREHVIDDASQRRSLRHLAALVDYPLDDGSGAFAWIDVQAIAPGLLAAGLGITDARNQGRVRTRPRSWPTPARRSRCRNARNQFAPYIWDEDATCLFVGGTGLTLIGNQAASIPA